MILANSNIFERISCPEAFDGNGKLKEYYNIQDQNIFQDTYEETPIFGNHESRQSRDDYAPSGINIRKSLFGGTCDEEMTF